MRPARDGFASMASFPCPEQPADPNPFAGQPPTLTAALLLDGLNKASAAAARCTAYSAPASGPCVRLGRARRDPIARPPVRARGAHNAPASTPPPLPARHARQVLSVDQASSRMSVQAQITLRDLYAAATAAGLSVPRSGLPWWQGLTLGGAMATSSHGTGLNTTSMIVSSRAPRRGGR